MRISESMWITSNYCGVIWFLYFSWAVGSKLIQPEATPRVSIIPQQTSCKDNSIFLVWLNHCQSFLFI